MTEVLGKMARLRELKRLKGQRKRARERESAEDRERERAKGPCICGAAEGVHVEKPNGTRGGYKPTGCPAYEERGL